MNKITIRIIVTALLLVCTQIYSQTGLLLPSSPFFDEIIEHKAFTLGYSEDHEQARWVSYELTRAEVYGTQKRRDEFREDPHVSTGSAKPIDYKGSGYDRGHLAPAADMKLNQNYMSESFYMSNISPQLPGFNRGVWKRLETTVRQIAINNESIYIVTGPILTENMGNIGPSEVTIPSYFYKVILDYAGSEIKSIGFILPNQSSKLSLSFFAMSVDVVEERTGLDFFPFLQDDIEDSLEAVYDYSLWTGKKVEGVFQDSPGRCKAITQKGSQCKRKANSGSKYCWQHK